jgi:hypothetical protein
MKSKKMIKPLPQQVYNYESNSLQSDVYQGQNESKYFDFANKEDHLFEL